MRGVCRYGTANPQNGEAPEDHLARYLRRSSGVSLRVVRVRAKATNSFT